MSANHYLCPEPYLRGMSVDTYGKQLIGWSRDIISQGSTYLRQQPAYPYIQQGMDIINGLANSQTTSTLSDVTLESVVRNAKELIAAQSNIRIIPSFRTEVEEQKDQANILNKLYMSWQRMTFADRAIRKAWQYAVAAGTGYIGIRWNPDYWYTGKGDIELFALGPLDVIPVGLPSNHNLQQAYAVAIRVSTPWHEVINRYPEFRDKITPNAATATMTGGPVSRGIRAVSTVINRFMPGSQSEQELKPWANVDVYHIYVDDRTINLSGAPILMGDPGTSWEYTVPYLGQTIPADRPDTFRIANAQDCLMYPNRRKIVCTQDCVLNPDPCLQVNEYWHARVPIVQWRADDWAWSFLGFSLTKGGASLESANIQMLRGTVDAVNVRLNPPKAFDRNTMSAALAQGINTRIPNTVVGLDMTFGGEQLKPLLPPSYYEVNVASTDAFIEANEARITKQMGVADAVALSRARQLPSGDSLEKIMDAMGPIIKDQSRNMESSVRDLGEMWKSCAFQFYSATRRMQIEGKSGITDEDWNFDPGTLLPDAATMGLSVNTSKLALARRHSGQFTFTVTPYSLHEFNSVSRKLIFLQLSRFGFPVSWWKLAEVFDIDNFGPKPVIEDPENPGEYRTTLNELETWIAQQEMTARMQAAAAGGQAQAAGGTAPQGPKGQAVGSTPGHKGPGRPPTAQEMPQIEMKSDGRPIIRESKR